MSVQGFDDCETIDEIVQRCNAMDKATRISLTESAAVKMFRKGKVYAEVLDKVKALSKNDIAKQYLLYPEQRVIGFNLWSQVSDQFAIPFPPEIVAEFEQVTFDQLGLRCNITYSDSSFDGTPANPKNSALYISFPR